MIHLCLVIQPVRRQGDAALAESFERFGIKAFFVAGTEAARALLVQMRFDALVVDDDAASPQALAQQLSRLAEFDMPILVFRGNACEEDEVHLLEAGAREVVSKAASLRLAALRVVKAAQAGRARHADPQSTLVVGPLRLDPLAHSATLDGAALALTPKQFDLLFELASCAGKLVHRGALNRALRLDADDVGRGLDMQICRVRKSIRDAGNLDLSILSVYSFGYCLVLRSDAARGAPEGVDDSAALALAGA